MVHSKKAEVRRQRGIGAMRTVLVAVVALLCSGATSAAPPVVPPVDVPPVDVPLVDVPLVDVPLVDAVRRGDEIGRAHV